MINWFDMPAEGLSNGGLFEVKELEVTENGTYETSGEMYNKVTVNVEGGGGSSDFSTAEVQLTIPTGVANVSVYGAFCVDYEEISATDYLVNETGTHTAILYKGKGLITILMGAGRSATVSGNIENIDTNGYLITGDCTITIS